MGTRGIWRHVFQGRRPGHAHDEDLATPTVVGLDEQGVTDAARVEAKSKTWETTVTRVESWPEEARLLKKHNWISYLYLVGDVILAILPLYFILLGIAVIVLNGKPTEGNSFGPKVESAIELGPTVFPIVFAAVSGRSMKMIARYLAERGARLGTLELLMASQSVWGAVESQLLMQRLTFVGANLLFLWALSPLGGQASLRLMKRNDRLTYSNTKLRYLSTGPAATMWATETTFGENGRLADTAALYGSVLLAPQTVKTGPQDLWGNVKIPSLEALNSSIPDSDGWISMPSSVSSPEVYSSLVGLPVVGLMSNSSSIFNLESTYLSLACLPFEKKTVPRGKSFIELVKLGNSQVWGPIITGAPFEKLDPKASFFVDTNFPLFGGHLDDGDDILLGRLDGFVGNPTRPQYFNRSILSDDELRAFRHIQYVSKFPDDDPNHFTLGANIGNCSLSQTHVETKVRCANGQCKAEKIRKSLMDKRPAASTGFDHFRIMQAFAESFPLAALSDGSSPTDRFLSNTSASPFLLRNGNQKENVTFVDISRVPIEVFSRRLSLILNSYMQLATQPTAYFGSLSSNLSIYGPDTMPMRDIDAYLPSNVSATNLTFNEWWPTFLPKVGEMEPPFIGATAMANTTTTETIFTCDFAWLALLFACSGVILITGGVALVLKRKTLGPELFGFVASMTYQNRYLKIPEGGSMLDAMERARLLRDIEVYVADVRGNDDIGHIAFAAGVPLRKLERGRMYS